MLGILPFSLKTQVLMDNEYAEAMLRGNAFWKLTKPKMNIYLGVLDTPTSIFQFYLPDTVLKKESKGIITIGKSWHKNTVTPFQFTERIDSILRITDEQVIDSGSLKKFYFYYDQGYDLYCAYGHFLAFEDSVKSFSGRYFGISQHYFMARIGVHKTSGKYVADIVGLDSVELMEPKQIYAGYFAFYPKKNETQQGKRYPFFLTEKLPLSIDKKTRVLPDLRPIGMWKFKTDALIKCPNDMQIPPFGWWSTNVGMSLPGGDRKRN